MFLGAAAVTSSVAVNAVFPPSVVPYNSNCSINNNVNNIIIIIVNNNNILNMHLYFINAKGILPDLAHMQLKDFSPQGTLS